jgi:hypothetical protein
MTDKEALAALSKHKQPQFGYRVTPDDRNEDLRNIEFDIEINVQMTMYGKTFEITGSAEDIYGFLKSVAEHIKLRYMPHG